MPAPEIIAPVIVPGAGPFARQLEVEALVASINAALAALDHAREQLAARVPPVVHIPAR
jgi:hypothetical protein